MRDPYQVLGLSRSANEAEIKKAFRRLAKQHHPDRNKEDPKAKDKFAEVNAAYEILGDKDKRSKFDRGEIDAEGKDRFQGFGAGRGAGGFRQGAGPDGFEHFSFDFGGAGAGPRSPQGNAAGMEDIIAELFGRGARGGQQGSRAQRHGARGSDLTFEMEVSLEEVAKGGKRRVALATGREIEVTIPAGIEAGKQIRLRGLGEPGQSGGGPGDALVTVRYQRHPVFDVEGKDLRASVDVPLEDAVLGGAIRVPTLGGAVEMKLPAGAQGGKTLRLKGKGLPLKTGAGDLLVRLNILIPADDKELQALMRSRREARAGRS
jgi:DnaJ-class molecular chaperone